MSTDPAAGSDGDDVDQLDDVELRRHVASDDGAADGEDLVSWVRWLVTRYELDNIPDCWTQHGALVEELDALRIGWHSTIARGQTGLAPMQWHDYLGRTLERLDRRWRTRCDDGHRTATLPTWVTTDLHTLEIPDLAGGRYQP
jgi:hypothetical protein